MNILKQFKYFDFNIFVKHMNKFKKIDVKIHNTKTIKGFKQEYIEVVFLSEDFTIFGFIVFDRFSSSIYKYKRMYFKDDIFKKYAKHFVGISISPADLEYIKSLT